MHYGYTPSSHGYYHLFIGHANSRQRFMTSNDERAFVMSRLHSLLSMRSVLDEPFGYRSLPARLDLLAFSLLSSDIQLVLFSISEIAAREFGARIVADLEAFQSDYLHRSSRLQIAPNFRLQKLSGPHHALSLSTYLHARHTDWEYDRYSSIGFYLHDRRGDWMRLWRLSRLYENQPERYRQLLEVALQRHGAYPTSARAIMA